MNKDEFKNLDKQVWETRDLAIDARNNGDDLDYKVLFEEFNSLLKQRDVIASKLGLI